MLSILVNAAAAAAALAAVAAHGRKAPLNVLMRYFTTLSNLFCASASLAVAAARLCGKVPYAVLVLKYISTVSVGVTLMTVMLFLGPAVYGFRPLLIGPDLWLHLICPVLAILSLLLWDRPEAPFGIVWLGVLPVLLYGAVYIFRVMLAPEGKRWEDFYGFCSSGRWYISFPAMVFGAFLISIVLWIL